MSDSVFVLRTAEVWVRYNTAANVYSERLCYAIFEWLTKAVVRIPDGFVDAIVSESADFRWLDGFSLETGRHRIVFSDEPLLVARAE